MLKNIVFLSAILYFGCSSTIAGEWVSPIDKKYLSKNSDLFLKFDEARSLLNSWGGRRETLERADNLLSEILSVDPEYAPAYREYGRLYIMDGHINYDNFREGSLSPAEAAISKSLELEPEYADSYVLLGHLYTKMKRYNDAENALSKAEYIGTEIPWLPLNRADLLKKQRKYSEAMQLYQSVVEKGTTNRKAYANALAGVTTMYRYLKDYDKANEWYEKQLAYSPNDAWTWGNYASFLLFRYKDPDAAIEKAEKALSIMNYGMGRFTLACGLYTKWAILKQDASTINDAQLYFDQAWELYPYPEKVINKTTRYPFTRITAYELQKWLTSQASGTP